AGSGWHERGAGHRRCDGLPHRLGPAPAPGRCRRMARRALRPQGLNPNREEDEMSTETIDAEATEVPAPRTPKRLAAKLVEAAKDVEGVGKRGFNQQQHYTYVTAEDIAEAAARALLKHEVFTDFEVLEVKSETIKSNRGGEGRLVTIKGRLIAT